MVEPRCLSCGDPIEIVSGHKKRVFCPTCTQVRMYLGAAEKQLGRLTFRNASSDQRRQLRGWLFELVNKIPPDSIRGAGGRFAKRP
jgi:predicted RNA-binding Zn-ribbon protein involved in translation (DUF1610 family)